MTKFIELPLAPNGLGSINIERITSVFSDIDPMTGGKTTIIFDDKNYLDIKLGYDDVMNIIDGQAKSNQGN